jgi:hypothetical protein
LPQPPQKRSALVLWKPQAGQACGNAVPHCAQKRRPSLFSIEHFGQSMQFRNAAYR